MHVNNSVHVITIIYLFIIKCMFREMTFETPKQNKNIVCTSCVNENRGGGGRVGEGGED